MFSRRRGEEEEKKNPSTRLPYLEMNFFDGKKGTLIIFFPYVSNFCSIKRDESVIQR